MLKHSLLLSLHSNHQPFLSPKCLTEVVPWERREKRTREVPSDECGHGSQTLVSSETLVTQDRFGRHFVVTVWASYLSFLPCRAEHQMLCILCECSTLHTIDSFSDANGSFATSTFLGFCAEEATL